MGNFIVYAYARVNGVYYYIGKGRPNRPYKYRKTGIKPPRDKTRIHILHKNLSEQTAFEYENKLILLYGRKDLNTGFLYNRTNGGESVSGWIPSEQWRKNKSDSMEGKNNPFYGQTHTSNSRDIISRKAKQRMSDPKTNYFYGKSPIGELNPMFGKPRLDLSERNKLSPPARGTRWYNNGIVDRRFKEGDVLEGFKLGRLKVATGHKRPDVSERNRRKLIK